MFIYWLIWTLLVVVVTILWRDAKHRNQTSFNQGVVNIFDMAVERVKKAPNCSIQVLRDALYLKASFALEHKQALFKAYKKKLRNDHKGFASNNDFGRVHITQGFDARLAYTLLESGMEAFWLAVPQRQNDQYPLVYEYYEAPHAIKQQVLKQIAWLAEEFESGRYPQRVKLPYE